MILLVFLLFLFSACDFVSDTKNLGGGYYFDTDEILFTENLRYNGVGFCVIPPEVKEFEKNENYIIVKSLNINQEISYWIIKKEDNHNGINNFRIDSLYGRYYDFSNILGPMDSMLFFKTIERESIPLRFEK